MRSTRHFCACGALVVIGLVIPPLAQSKQGSRIAQRIDNSETVILKGNLNPRARSQYDQGRVEPDLRLGYITLMLKQSPQQQTQLKHLLAEQQDRSSPNYHNWLTPEQFAERFGVDRDDIHRIVSWLEEEGFAISHVARSRNWVSFTGTATQVEVAFHTEIHRYKVDGEIHFANATEPRIPRALDSVVMGLRGLDDFHPRPMGIERDLPNTNGHRWGPDFTDGAGNHFLAPDDLATIYDITPLYNAGFDGSGQRLAVVGQSDINLADLEAFRSIFHLSANDPQQILVPGSTDPGFTKDQGEADLDLEWSGAVAKNATIIYVNSTGVFNSAQYAIEQNLAPVISVSFGLCEPVVGSTDLSSLESLAQQANAQGITILAASGDSGAAGCDPAFTTAVASQGLTVNVPASLSEVTGVGGTEFNEGSGTYWGGNGPNFGSAISLYLACNCQISAIPW
jgi:subtilase family serine protease